MSDKVFIFTVSAVLMFSAADGLNAAGNEAGKKIFDTKCVSCHGKEAKGNPNMAKVFKIKPEELDLTSAEIVKDSDEELLKAIANGEGKMPAYGKQLKAEEQKFVLQYIRSLSASAEKPKSAEPAVVEKKLEKPADAAEPAKPASETGKNEYAKSCASCHGKDGKGNAAMSNVFKVEPAALDLSDEATLAKSDQDLAKVIADGLNKMPAYKGKVSGDVIAEIVSYMRSLKTTK